VGWRAATDRGGNSSLGRSALSSAASQEPVKPIVQEPEPLPSPTACPFCGSPKIATTTERVDASTYWRCVACGEMWNLGRLRASSQRYDDRPRWR
jgi:formate dehydrogenase maturation protein FdhE